LAAVFSGAAVSSPTLGTCRGERQAIETESFANVDLTDWERSRFLFVRTQARVSVAQQLLFFPIQRAQLVVVKSRCVA
jgi:hypothetical protein